MRDTVAVVIPTLGRASLERMLASLARCDGARPDQVVIVDDRPATLGGCGPLPPRPARLDQVTTVVASHGRGPAAARNAGWRTTDTDWVVFLDDDIVLPEDWRTMLDADLAAAGQGVGGVQGRIEVPLPSGRRPDDWERQTAGLMTAAWATADMAYRRTALLATGGFDERFRSAYREDAELALRVQGLGWSLVRGDRRVVHPVRPESWWVSARRQRGNADDALVRRLHGDDWRVRAAAPRGLLPAHVVTTGLLAGAVASALARRPVPALACAAGWAAMTGWFTGRRVLPGPRTAEELARMLTTSAVIPPLAVWHRPRGELQHRDVRPWSRPRAVLFDRDGTLVHDVPYNGDPALVAPVDGAADVVAHLRERGLRVGVVTNQSGVARGLIRAEDVQAVNAAVDAAVGPFDVWVVCPHADGDGCGCRKPSPGMVLSAAEQLGIPPSEVVVVGDTGADVQAAERAGARGVLVPNAATLPREVETVELVAVDLREAVVLGVGPGAGERS